MRLAVSTANMVDRHMEARLVRGIDDRVDVTLTAKTVHPLPNLLFLKPPNSAVGSKRS